MPRIKLDQKIVDRMRAPDPSGKQKLYWDRSKAGFGVRVSGSMNSISYIVQRTLPNGLDRRVTLGATSAMSLEEARNKADEEIQAMRKGIDPKAVARSGVALKEAAEAYLAARPNTAESSIRDYRRVFEDYLKNWRGEKLSEITREMVERRHLDLGKERGPATANGAMRALRAVFNFSVGRYPDVIANPVKLTGQWFDVPRRERHVKADELARFYTAVMNLANPVQRDYVLLMLFTGLRSKEAAALAWHDVDFAARMILLPAVRTKAKRKLDLPMTDVVFKLLTERRAIGDATYVFPAHGKTGHIASPKHPFELIAESSGIVVSPHDLRRTFAKAAVAAGVHIIFIKALLNHASGKGDVTVGYIELNNEDLREPAQKVANVLKKWCRSKV
jgi:integrase